MKETRRSELMASGTSKLLVSALWIPLWFVLSLFFGLHFSTIVCVILFACTVISGIYQIIKAIVGQSVGIVCPYCNTSNSILTNVKTFDCSECKSTVLNNGGIGEKLN